jgi:hypothetical protein
MYAVTFPRRMAGIDRSSNNGDVILEHINSKTATVLISTGFVVVVDM